MARTVLDAMYQRARKCAPPENHALLHSMRAVARTSCRHGVTKHRTTVSTISGAQSENRGIGRWMDIAIMVNYGNPHNFE